MILPPDAVSTRRPSRLARACYVVSGSLVKPAMRRFSTTSGGGRLNRRMSAVGRVIGGISRLQRVRPIRGMRFDRVERDGVVIETVRTAGCTAALRDGVILYFHGGGFVCGSLDSHLHVVVGLARRTGRPVVHVEYRQHPDVKIDGSVRDCLIAYRWLLEQGADPAKVVFAGDSAGGYLAFALVSSAQQHGLPIPAGVIGISPLLELDNEARRTHENVSRDRFGVDSVMPLITECVRPAAGTADPSPVGGQLDAFPPSLITIAETEILRCDAERMYTALIAAGRDCTVRAWPSTLHAFPAMLPFLPESREAFDAIEHFIDDCYRSAPQTDRPDQGISA